MNKSNTGNATPGPKYAKAGLGVLARNKKKIIKTIRILFYSSNLNLFLYH